MRVRKKFASKCGKESDGHAGSGQRRWKNRESERECVWEINPGELEGMKNRTMSTRTRIRGRKTD